MKSHWSITTIAGISAMLAVQVQGIEAPADDTPPPTLAGESVETVRDDHGFIGIVTEAIPQILSTHLGVQPGDGVIVKAVMPDGPAAKAGIGTYDIITHIDQKPIQSPTDLSRKIDTHEPGKVITIGLIQKGKPEQVKVTIGNRPANVARHEAAPLERFQRMGIPDEMAQRMRDMIEGNLRDFDMPFGPQGHPDVEQAFQEMHRRLRESLDANPQAKPDGGISFEQNATIRMLDEDGSIEIKTNNGTRDLTVRDADQKVIWQGPWTSDEDKAAAPDDIRQRVERLNIDQSLDGSTFKFRIPGLTR